MKLMVIPRYDRPDKGEGGIRRVVEAQVKYLPRYDFEIVDKITQADIVATHAAEVPDIPVGKPWIVHTHGLYWAEYDWPGWGDRVNAQVIEAMKRCDHVTAPSEWVAYALKRGMWLRPTVLHHGIDPELWEPKQNQGYVIWNKARTDVISDPVPMNQLAKLCRDVKFVSTFGNATQNVRIIGKKNFEGAAEDIKHAGAYLATARETFGIGTLEAMASGVPVVGWNWGGQVEIIRHGETGWLAPVGDYDDLRKGLYWCLNNREKIGQAAREDVLRRFTWERVMASYADLYRKFANREEETRSGPKVSIIVPCHNLAHLLPEMIRSVQDQTFKNWEMVVIDDSSLDNSYDIAKQFALEDSRISMIRSDRNLKLPGALNLGFSYAKGRYIMNLDPDNMIPANTLKVLSDALDNDRSLHIAYGRIKFVLEDGVTPDPITGTDDGISQWPPPFNCLSQFKHRNQIPSTCLARREVFERTGGYRDRAKVAEDAEFWTRAVSYGFQPRMVTDHVTYVYRYRSESKSRSETEPDWTAWMPWTKNANLMPFGVAGKPPQEMGRSWPVPSCGFPLVTVVIPVGPAHKELVIDALDSLEAQTFRQWSCIVVNDTGEALSVPHPWVTIIDTEGKQGPAVARNKGISLVETEVFVCLDADDILEPTCLEDQWAEWKRVGGIIYSQWWDDKDDGNKIEIWNPPEWDPALLVSKGCIHAICAMYPLSAWEKVGGFDTNMRRWEDWDFQLAYASMGICAHKIGKPLFTYRKTTGTRRDDDMANKGDGLELMKSKWPDIFDNGASGKEKLKMACGGCGQNRKRPPRQAPAVAVQPLPSSGEVELLEYIGPTPKATWVGKKTGRKYIFGYDPNHRKRFVYMEDVDGFLAMQKAFRRANGKEEVEVEKQKPVLAGVMEG